MGEIRELDYVENGYACETAELTMKSWSLHRPFYHNMARLIASHCDRYLCDVVHSSPSRQLTTRLGSGPLISLSTELIIFHE